MVYSGKIYETDGANPVAVHEAEAVRPLSPIPHAPSFRIFRSDLQPEDLVGVDAEEPNFFYGNPMSLVGASQLINHPEMSFEVSVLPLVAAVLVGDVYRIDVEEADDAILGITLVNLLIARDIERRERRAGVIGRSHDLGGAIGPVLTTPDELVEEVQSAEFGRQYSMASVLRVNGVERGRGSLLELPITFAQAIAAASQTCTLKAGDILALGPVVTPEDPIVLDPGDEVQLAVDKLGALSLKLTNPQ